MKLCKDCEHFDTSKWGNDNCLHESALMHQDPVSGNKYYHPAREVRKATNEKYCGPFARYHSLKPQNLKLEKTWKDYLPAFLRNLL